MDRFLSGVRGFDVQAKAAEVGTAFLDNSAAVDEMEGSAPERLAAQKNVGGDR